MSFYWSYCPVKLPKFSRCLLYVSAPLQCIQICIPTFNHCHSSANTVIPHFTGHSSANTVIPHPHFNGHSSANTVIRYVTGHVITYPCWDWSWSMLINLRIYNPTPIILNECMHMSSNCSAKRDQLRSFQASVSAICVQQQPWLAV